METKDTKEPWVLPGTKEILDPGESKALMDLRDPRGPLATKDWMVDLV